MMNESVQHGYAHDSMQDFEAMKNFMENESMEKIREQEITRIRQIHSRAHKWASEGTKRFVKGPLRRPRTRCMNLDEIYRMPPLFTWRC
jgi:hypothetical protein